MADNLDEALAEGNGERAVRLYFDLVDQAYGKPSHSLEVRAGMIENTHGQGDFPAAAVVQVAALGFQVFCSRPRRFAIIGSS